MKNRVRNCMLTLLLLLATHLLHAQEARFKLGFGGNYVANNYEEHSLDDYVAYSLNTSYTLLQQQRFSVLWEQNILLRQRENDRFRKQAFIISLPLSFRYQTGRTGIYVGAGPAYLLQRYEDYSLRQRVRGLQAIALGGVALRSKPFAEVLFLEYHIRAGVHHSLNNTGNMAPFASLLVQLGSSQRVKRVGA